MKDKTYYYLAQRREVKKYMMPKIQGKRGNFGLLQGAFVSFVIIGVLAVVGLQIMGDVQDDLTAGSSEFNASVNVIDGMSDLASRLPLIALVIGLVVVLVFVFLIAQRSRT